VPPVNPPKLHLNEHLSPRLAVQLRRYGFDVTSSQESRLLSDDDSTQFAYAVTEQRAILTFNFTDFVVLHDRYLAEGTDHWGVILSTEESIGVLMHRILRLLNTVSAEELKNQVRWLNEFR
jgi:predicted nuclease of predicted toxin-antitoxin system